MGSKKRLPQMAGGSASALSLSRPAQASLTLRPARLLNCLKRPLSRGSSPAGYPTEPLVSYQINRQLSGWNLPPLVIRAFGAHCHEETWLFTRSPHQRALWVRIERLRFHAGRKCTQDNRFELFAGELDDFDLNRRKIGREIFDVLVGQGRSDHRHRVIFSCARFECLQLSNEVGLGLAGDVRRVGGL